MTLISLLLVILLVIIAVILIPIIGKRIYLKYHPSELTSIVRYDYDHARMRGKFFYDLRETFIHYRIMNHKLVVDAQYYLAYPKNFRIGIEMEKMLSIQQCWTNASSVQIREMGYKKVERLHDNLTWLGVPCYIRFENAKKFDTPMEKDPATGIYLHPVLTPSLSYDKMKSNATQDFLKDLKKGAPRDIDVHTMVMIAVVGIGAILGLWLMGVF